MKDREHHFTIEVPKIERRADNRPVIVGHAALFDTLSVPLYGFREKIQKGAFTESLKRGDDVRALFNHDETILLGRTKNRTLSLREDERGLAVEIFPPDTAAARDVISLIERGDVDQMSFGFRIVKDHKEINEDGETIRTLIEVELFDVSPVTFPAYTATDVTLRALKAFTVEHEARAVVEPQARARGIELAAVA